MSLLFNLIVRVDQVLPTRFKASTLPPLSLTTLPSYNTSPLTCVDIPHTHIIHTHSYHTRTHTRTRVHTYTHTHEQDKTLHSPFLLTE